MGCVSLAAGTVWEVQQHSEPSPLALLLSQARKGLSLHFPSFVLGWRCRVGAKSRNRILCTGAKDGRKPPPLLALTTSGEINTLSVILRQFREIFSENLL